jgi:hypothetical protein
LHFALELRGHERREAISEVASAAAPVRGLLEKQNTSGGRSISAIVFLNFKTNMVARHGYVVTGLRTVVRWPLVLSYRLEFILVV